LALQSLSAQFLGHFWHAVPRSQDAAPLVPDGDCDLANEVKGKSMLAMAGDLGVAYQTSFVLAHKMREAMSAEVRQTAIGGEGKRAEVDGGYFGGYVKPASRREDRKDRRRIVNQTGKRKVVVVIRGRGPDGKTLPGVFRNEADALNFIRTREATRGCVW
jgi:hypothetical protein